MKIAFLNSCLEPGRDGVGDYTRSLAQECVRQGHECCLVALNDRWAEVPPKMAVSDGLPELRLSSVLSWSQRIEQARKTLDAFAPDWVSLQFVPYAFHPKGFVHGLGHRLRPLLAGRRVHVMFHELWLGEAQDASPKHQLIGILQKAFVRQLLRQIKPQVVHTSNCAYIDVLARQGVSAMRLPMFGSIPITAHKGDDWLFAEIGKAGVVVTRNNRDDFWLAGFFGAMHPIWPPEPLISRLCQAAADKNRRLVLLSAGQMGGGEALWAQMEARYAPDVTFVCLGPQPVERVSEYFNSLDFGIATSPWSLIGKSSSVAAMLEHGLPVIVNRDDAKFSGVSEATLNDEPLLHRMDGQLVQKLVTGLNHSQSASRLTLTVQQFISSLTQFSPHHFVVGMG